MTIQVKITGVDDITKAILVKFVSPKSAKSIDEYDAMAFTITDSAISTKEDFIDSIMPQLQGMCDIRDAEEQVHGAFTKEHLDTWVGTNVTKDRVASSMDIINNLIDPPNENQFPLVNPVQEIHL